MVLLPLRPLICQVRGSGSLWIFHRMQECGDTHTQWTKLTHDTPKRSENIKDDLISLFRPVLYQHVGHAYDYFYSFLMYTKVCHVSSWIHMQQDFKWWGNRSHGEVKNFIIRCLATLQTQYLIKCKHLVRETAVCMILQKDRNYCWADKNIVYHKVLSRHEICGKFEVTVCSNFRHKWRTGQSYSQIRKRVMDWKNKTFI